MRVRYAVLPIFVAIAAWPQDSATVTPERREKALEILDKAAQKGVIGKKTAARAKSRLTLAVNKLAASA